MSQNDMSQKENKSSYSVSEANVRAVEDLVVDIWRRNLPAQAAASVGRVRGKFEWYYLNNPVGQGRIWLIEKDGTNVGTAGMGFRRIKVFGREILSGVAADMAVDAKHRVLGPALMLQRPVYGLAGSGVDAVYAMPNPGATAAMKRTGYKVPGGLYRYTRVLNPSAYLQSRIKNRPAAALLSAAAKPIMRLVSKETRVGMPRGCRLVTIDRFDKRFDELWKKMAAGFPVIAERSADYLNWRFAACPSVAYLTLALTDGNDAVRGYVIYHRDGDIVELADLSYDGDERTFDVLMSAFIRRMYKEGAASIFFSFFGSRALKERIGSFGFIKRKDSVSFALAAGSDHELAKALQDEENWFLTSGDMDN